MLIDQTLLVAQIINFILLVGLLYWLLYKPVREFMDKRTAEIEQQIKSAEENQKAAEALRLDLENQAKESRQQARQFLDDATKRAEVAQAEMMAEARKEADAIIKRAQEMTVLEREKAWDELKAQVGELSLLLASKVINESLDQAQHQQLIDQTLSQLDALKAENIQ
ncbi:MAG: F0F1 ATP synthase subunit B [Firmicutes bacterium]|nr:F0F1 ATP synthase subunit B [Bacillota bacterium]